MYSIFTSDSLRETTNEQIAVIIVSRLAVTAILSTSE